MKFPSSLLLGPIVLFLLSMSLPCKGEKAMRVLHVAVGETKLEDCVLYDGATSRRIDLPRRNLSEPLPLPDGDLVVRALQKPLGPEEPMPEDAPSVRIPEEWARCVLVFMPDPSNKVFPVRIIAVEASDAKMPLGHTLLFNCTEATLKGTFGGVGVTCKPGRSVKIPPPRRDSGDYNVAIDCIYPGETIVRPVCRATWNHNPVVRQFLFATPELYRKLPHIWGVNDLPLKDETADEGEPGEGGNP